MVATALEVSDGLVRELSQLGEVSRLLDVSGAQAKLSVTVVASHEELPLVRYEASVILADGNFEYWFLKGHFERPADHLEVVVAQTELSICIFSPADDLLLDLGYSVRSGCGRVARLVSVGCRGALIPKRLVPTP